MKQIILIVILSITFLSGAERELTSNQGHRGGCEAEMYLHLPENSLICLEAGLQGYNGESPLQNNEEFRYLEFDVYETKDGNVIVYHGGSNGRLFSGRHATLKFDEINRQIYESLNIKKSYKNVKVGDLTAEEIQLFVLSEEYKQKVPTLEEYFNEIAKFNLLKPIMIEVKFVSCRKSEMGKNPAKLLIEIAKSYMKLNGLKNPSKDRTFNSQKLGIMIGNGEIHKLGGRECIKSWGKLLKDTNIRVYKTRTHKEVRKVKRASR